MKQEPALILGCPPAHALTRAVLAELARRAGGPIVEPCPAEFTVFPNTELLVRIERSVRQRHVIVVQAPCAYGGQCLDASFRQFKLTLDALRRASAVEVTGVLTEFPYQRQERKDDPRTPISARQVADEIEGAFGSVPGKRIVCIDLHAPAIQGFFTIPFDALTAITEIVPALAAAGYFTVVSPDVGGAKRAEVYVHLLEEYRGLTKTHPEVEMALIYKRRKGPQQVEVSWVTGRHVIEGRDVVIVDDILSTGGTAVAGVEKCRELGARRVGVAVTHAECSKRAWERLGPAVVDDVFITDSLPLDRLLNPLPPHWHVVSVAPLLAEAIAQILGGGSVSGLERRRPRLP